MSYVDSKLIAYLPAMNARLQPSQTSCALHLQLLHEQYQSALEQCRSMIQETKVRTESYAAKSRRRYRDLCRRKLSTWASALNEHLSRELAQVRQKILSHYEPLILELAYDLARRVLHEELTQSSTSLQHRLHSILEQYASEVRGVVLNPDDVEALGLDARAADIEVSREIPRGGFRILLPEGAADYNPEQELEKLIESIR